MLFRRSIWLIAGAVYLALLPSATAATVQLTKADCRRLVEHFPSDDVAYREGVDVRGRPVAPADLPGTRRIRLPETYIFNIEVRPFDFVERRRLSEDSEIIADVLSENATTLTLGTAVVTADGRAYFNGVALHDEIQRALALGCRDALQGD